MYMNLFDSHVHSDNSHDGEHSITFLCENAEQKSDGTVHHRPL